MTEQITAFDFFVLDSIQAHLRCALLDTLMPIVSFLGNGGIVWLVITAVLLAKKNTRKQGAVLLIGMSIGFLIGNLILKPFIARPRPNWINTEAVLLIENPTDFSFPSGHTLSSFIAAILIYMNHKKFGYIAIPFACIMAFSRLYLYVHYPSDILASIILAFCIALVVHKICYRKRL